MANTMQLKELLREEAQTVYAVTEKLMRRSGGADLGWRPATGGNWMTLGQLLMHCAAFGCGEAVKGFVRGEWNMPEEGEASQLPPADALPAVGSVDEALRLLENDRRLTMQCLEEVREEELLSKRCVAPWGGPEKTLFQYLLMMIEHLSQHKGQLFYYLKMMGHDIGTAELWGE